MLKLKKLLAVIATVCMVVVIATVCVLADDEVIWSEDTMFFSAGNWESYTIEDPDGLLEALQTDGAVLTITRDAESGVTDGGTSSAYENFILIDSWYTCDPYVWLGTAGHTTADEPSKEGLIDCLSDDGLVCTYDAATVYAAYKDAGGLDGGSPIIVSNTSASGVYNITNISVIVPETTADDTPHSITVESVTAGSQTLYTYVSASEATEGTTVTFSTQDYPLTSSELHTDGESSGYVVSGLSVVDAEGNSISTSSDSMGSYTFVMPASDVVVTPIVTNYYLSSAEIGVDWEVTVQGILSDGDYGYYEDLVFTWDSVDSASYYMVFGAVYDINSVRAYGEDVGSPALVLMKTTSDTSWNCWYVGDDDEMIGATSAYAIVFAYDESGNLLSYSHGVAYAGSTNTNEVNLVNNGLSSTGGYEYTVSWDSYDTTTEVIYSWYGVNVMTARKAASSYRVQIYSSADGSLYLDSGNITELSLTADFVSGDTYYVFIYAFDESGIMIDSAGFTSFTAGVESANICGDNLTWSIDNGVLTISGTGDMYNYSCSYVAPWYHEKDNITSIVIEDGVTSIGSYAFILLENVTSVSIPETVTSIGTCGFYGCSSVTSIEIPTGVTSIPFYGFAECTSLETVDLNNVTSLGYGAFNGCESLVNIDLSNITSMEGAEFGGCTSLKEANLISLETCTEYSSGTLWHTFFGCTSLESVILPTVVDYINYGAFAYCENITDIYYTGSESEWDNVFIAGEGTYLNSQLGYTSYYMLGDVTIHYNYVETDDTSTTYTITITVTENGTVSVDPASAKEGVTVTVTVTANSGYTVAGITVVDSYGNTITVTVSGSSYSFVMPSSEVTITPIFEETSAEHTHIYVFSGWVWASDFNSAYGVFYCSECGTGLTVTATITSTYSYGVLTRTAAIYYDGTWYTDSKLDVTSISTGTTTIITTPTTDTTETTTETIEISEPVEPTDTETEDDGETTTVATAEAETNPTTGIAISFIPMAIAALAAVSSKRR